MNTFNYNHSGFRGEYCDKNEIPLGNRRPSIIIEREILSRKTKSNSYIFTGPKSTENSRKLRNENLRTLQAVLLALTVLILSYQGVRYGRAEYNILETGETVRGYVPSRKSIVALSFGYSASYAFLCAATAFMLLYSLFMKRPRWSLPLLVLYLTDLVCDVSDAIVVIWVLYGNLRFLTASFYTSLVSLLILGEIWMWLGVLRLYEYRTFN